MSYQLLKLSLQNTTRRITSVAPLYVEMGAMSGNDAVSLQVAVIVAAVSAGFTTATISLEQSADAGVTWATVPGTTAQSITGVGTFSIKLSGTSGVLLPNVRVKIIATTPGDELLLSTIYRTFAQSSTIVPPAAISAGMATEATSLSILAAVDGIETLIGSTNTKLDTIHTDIGTTIAGYVDGIETAIGSTNTKLDTLHTDIGTTIAGYVDGIETLVTNTNSALANISGYVDGIETLVTATNVVLAKIQKWPYIGYTTITPSEDAQNNYWTYKDGGGSSVAAITISKSTGIITYNPARTT